MQYCQDMPTPTSTSYAVLGLLSLRPWTAYELARQSERSLRWFFPRAERAVYLEAKRLVDLGWAEATETATGRRRSTVYAITGAGQQALRDWLGRPSGDTAIVSEAALKLFFADQATPEQMRATVTGMSADAARAIDDLAAMASRESQFPQRMDTNVLSMRLIAEIHRAVLKWAQWAEGGVDVLEAGDPDAITAQTRATLAEIAGGVTHGDSIGRPAAAR
jgi:PadR family transcriptional regulator, regulatory protein AphA